MRANIDLRIVEALHYSRENFKKRARRRRAKANFTNSRIGSYTRENGAGMQLLVNDRSICLHSLHNDSRTVVTRPPVVLEIDWSLLARRRRKIWGFVDCCHTFSFVICWICGSLFPSVHRRSGFGPPSAAGAHPRSGFRPPSAAGGTPPMGTPPI